jgi:hypothetical protein
LAEELDGAGAVGVEDVVDVGAEVVADGGWWDGDARCPLFDEVVDVEEAVVARGLEVVGELSCGECIGADGFGADGPDGGYPREIGASVPFVGEIDPGARADGLLDLLAGFEG